MRNLEIAAEDSFPLAASWFETKQPACAATVIISSATGVLRRYYRPFADYLTSLGFDAVTFDYRGIGASRPTSIGATEVGHLGFFRERFRPTLWPIVADWLARQLVD